MDMTGPTGLPVAFTNFNNNYVEGGFSPSGGAEINVASEAASPQPPQTTADAELAQEGATITSRSTTTVSGTTCARTLYTTSQDGDLESSVAVYCLYGQKLYKFFLSYRASDPQESQYLSSFSQVLSNVSFAQ
jgi:hypothetical protein